MWTPEYYVLVVAAFLTAIFGGDPVVRGMLSIVERGISPKAKSRLDRNSLRNAGRLIGYLERALVFIMVLYNQLGAIAFILTAKSIIRFASARDRIFAEYFLVGTLTSILFAILLAIIVTRG
jgi:hypothetical protein